MLAHLKVLSQTFSRRQWGKLDIEYLIYWQDLNGVPPTIKLLTLLSEMESSESKIHKDKKCTHKNQYGVEQCILQAHHLH
jgi:hypothetical protein